MALPSITGSFSAHIGGVGTHDIDISAVAVGGWMVISAMAGDAAFVLTPPAGWSTILNGDDSGSRTNFLFVKTKTVGDGSTATFTHGGVQMVSYGVLWGTGAVDTANWGYSSPWHRNQSTQATGARYNSIALGVNTPTDDSLALAISHEATSAMTASNEVASIAPGGWTEQLWLPQVAVGDRIETIWMGTKAMPTAGNSGDVTLTYLSPQDSNGWTIQISIPSFIEPTLAPRLIGSPTTSVATLGTGTSSISIPRPLGVQNGDYIVVFLRNQSDFVATEPSSAGFTHLGPAFVSNSSSFRVNGYYGHIVTDAPSEPTTYSFSFTLSSGNGRCVATAFIVRGVDLTNPIAGFYDSYGGTAITGGREIGSYLITHTPVLNLFAAAAEFSASNNHVPLTLPSGYAVVSSVPTSETLSASRTYLWLGAQESATSPIAAASITWTAASSSAAQGIALRASDAESVSGDGYVAADGAGAETRLYYTSAGGARTPSQVIPVRRGFNTVAEMLATPGFTWAHRGGSASYPEMSLYAYTQAVVRGYGVLEVSLGRTSDGVWFGLHDQTTDRTSGGTYGNASSQTWAQIQSQQNVFGPGDPQPYMRWEEIVAAYGNTHILVIDPKYALGSHRTEFLNMVAADLNPERVIIKYSGGGSNATALSTAAQALGFETWGFFYADDASAGQGGNGNLQTWGPSWTLIGMAHGASQAIWDEALALGKPVIGHIAIDQTAYNTAMSKGAVGVQVSGVAVVDPVSWWTQ